MPREASAKHCERLCSAVEDGELEQVDALLDKYEFPQNLRDKDGWGVFHLLLFNLSKRSKAENEQLANLLAVHFDLNTKGGRDAIMWGSVAVAGCAAPACLAKKVKRDAARGRATGKAQHLLAVLKQIAAARTRAVVQDELTGAGQGTSAFGESAPGKSWGQKIRNVFGGGSGGTGQRQQQAQIERRRQTQMQQTVETQAFLTQVEQCFDTLRQFVRQARAGDRRTVRRYNKLAVQCVNMIGLSCEGLVEEGNATALELGKGRLQQFCREMKQADPDGFGLLRDMLAYFDDAVSGKETANLPTVASAPSSFNQGAVDTVMAAQLQAQHMVEDRAGHVRQDVGRYQQEHAAERARHRAAKYERAPAGAGGYSVQQMYAASGAVDLRYGATAAEARARAQYEAAGMDDLVFGPPADAMDVDPR